MEAGSHVHVDVRQGVHQPVGERRPPAAQEASLTPTGARVSRLVAEGLTNRQIGERLFVSPSMVQTHLVHAFAKLSVSTRAELAVQAA
jgi:DNA-binding CsgD family transcriptional regulator